MEHSGQECIKRAGISLSIMSDLPEEHILLIFPKICVNIDGLYVVTCSRLDCIDTTIVKLVNWKGAMKLLENENKQKFVDMYENSNNKNDDNNLIGDQVSVSEQVKDRNSYRYKKPKIFINQTLYRNYRILYGEVKKLVREGLIDLVWV